MSSPLQPTVFTVDWSDPANLKTGRQAWMGLFWLRGRRLAWIGGVALVLAALFFVGGNRLFPAVLGLLVLVCAVILVIGYLNIQRQIAERGRRSGRTIYRLDDQGLHMQMDRDTDDYDWNAVTRVIEHRDYLGLIMRGGELIAIPKRGLPIPAELWFGQIPAYTR